ncbi:hypothetical protein VOI54_03845 [Tamlana sp. 2201CG12-4]|uniref:hypothetical protein n=1 Tax=Tamlana sp. 2201CG12-4 TaxID=3112582 RepID=UPI002DB9EB7F|nr:hypothetical protein [Tamlana sp. 2201CG12-4]MEC3906136.1 hypothetical protein [Tamlana sp. 2201CG12-4]
MKNIKKEDLEAISIIINKPGMFAINKVEDFYFFFLGYTFKDEHLSGIMNQEFSKYVKEKLKFKDDNAKWYRIIRYYSTNDVHSVELFLNLFSNFLGYNDNPR